MNTSFGHINLKFVKAQIKLNTENLGYSISPNPSKLADFQAQRQTYLIKGRRTEPWKGQNLIFQHFQYSPNGILKFWLTSANNPEKKQLFPEKLFKTLKNRNKWLSENSANSSPYLPLLGLVLWFFQQGAPGVRQLNFQLCDKSTKLYFVVNILEIT